jgi:hypothetical protein
MELAHLSVWTNATCDTDKRCIAQAATPHSALDTLDVQLVLLEDLKTAKAHLGLHPGSPTPHTARVHVRGDTGIRIELTMGDGEG